MNLSSINMMPSQLISKITMSFFGTSKTDEEALRQAAQSNNVSDGLSVTESSAYETADEAEIDDGESQLVQEPIESAENDVSPENDDDDVSPEKDDNDRSSHTYEEDRNSDNVQLFIGTKISDEKHESESPSVEDEKVLTVAQLDWDDENDKANPYNWPVWKRWYITLTTAFICLCVSLGSSLYISGVFEIMNSTGCSREIAISGLTFYLLGLAFGPALAAPISEVFGRKIVYITSFPVSMLFTMGIGLSDKIYQILILRFFCGFLASPALAIAGGTINDIWKIEDRGFAMATFCLAPFLGPVLGPIVGGFAAEHKGWKWTMWVSLMFSGAVLPFCLMLPETYKPVILARRARKRGIKLHLPPTSQLIMVTLTITLFKPMQMLVVEPIVLLWSFYIAFVFAVLFGFFEAFPIIFQQEYQMDMGVSGLTFIGVGIGLVLGVVFFMLIDRLMFFKKNPDGSRGNRDANGNLIPGKPENILFIGKIGSICLPISLFWLGWTGRNDIHWMCPTASGLPFGFGLILIFFTNMLYFIMSFPPASVASALGANNLLRYLLASVFPLFTTQMYEKLGIDWATSLFGFIAIALLPIPWIFQIIGPKMRAISKFGYAAMMKQQAELHKKPLSQRQQDQEDIESDVASSFV